MLKILVFYEIIFKFVYMDNEQCSVAFEIKYSGTLFFCEAQLQVYSYKVYFNNRYMADMEYDAAAGWIQTNGTLLPTATIEEIGAHIDGQLD
ncbi:MAG TPA: hypothetical protein VNX40_12305 [Mucilaginibacter sp.]|jgi:hypothetical protein|nr:hypothetical protein [Mucilaginibacter sp.]